MSEEIPDVFHLTDAQKRRLMEHKPVQKHDYFPTQESHEGVDPDVLDKKMERLMDLMIEHLEKIRYR